MTFTSNELNYLIWKYLQESGFRHTAFTFSSEANINLERFKTANINSGALTSMVQKGLYYTEAMLCVQDENKDDKDKTLTMEGLSLMEAVSSESDLTKDKEKSEDRPNENQDSGKEKEIKNNQRDRDREARANHGQNNGAKRDKQQQSPRTNGTTSNAGVLKKKKEAAALINGEHTNGSRNEVEDIKMLQFPKEKTRFLKCHTSEVFICSWNPRSDLMASGSGDSTARIWDLRNSENSSAPDSDFTRTTRVLKHCSASDVENAENVTSNKDVTSLDWNAQGNLLATGCYDGHSRIWDANGVLKCTLGSHKGPVFALKWNTTGNLVLSAGVDRTTVVWDATLGSQVQLFDTHKSSALDVDWIDAETFASCSTDKTINVCKLGIDRPLKVFTGHENEVNAIKYDSHSRRLASCSDDMTLRIWSMEQNEAVHTFKAHQKEIYTIRWSPQGYNLASASFDHTVRLWDVRRGECVRTLSRHQDPVYSVAFSPDGRLLASGCFDRSVFIWDIHNGKLLQSYVGEKNQGGIFEVSWNFTGEKVAASASDGTVILLDVRHIRNRLS